MTRRVARSSRADIAQSLYKARTRPPSAQPASHAYNDLVATPMPFLVGAPRSGTTMLRLMMDAHPDLAIPPETGFLALCADWHANPPVTAADFVRRISHFPADAPTWPDFRLEEDALVAALGTGRPLDLPSALRTFYEMYAARFGKTRAGDKTPLYCFYLATIHEWLPEARFIHLVRDGRDVALSWRQTWFSPGPEMTDQAAGWVRHVEAVRNAARSAPVPVLEVRYETLVTSPAPVLEAICRFIELPFHPAMLQHHLRAAARLAEHGARVSSTGVIAVTAEQRRAQQVRTLGPVSNERVGAWRREMTHDEIRAFESVGGQLLDDLGYERGSS